MIGSETLSQRRGWQQLALRRLLVGIEQGWSPVAEDRVAEEDEWAVLKLSAVKHGRFIASECKALPQGVDPDARLEVRQGDVLLTRANTPGLVGDACFVREAVPKRMLSDLIYRLRPHGVDGRFLVYALLGDFTRGQISADARGSSQSMVKVSQGHIRSWTIMVPEELEQRRIVDFLDRKTASIDTLIAKEEQLLSLLAEKRQGLITQAVTKGLDPNAPMKDSGVDWIGEVPAHWSVQRVKHVARVESGHTPSRSVPEHWLDSNDIPWVSLNDTKWLAAQDYISETAYYINELGLQNSSARLLPARAVVFTRDATIGKAAITARPMAVSQHIIAWICGLSADPEYLLRVFYAMEPALEKFTFGATLRTIGMDDVRSLVTPLPPIDEQRRIVDHVQRSLQSLDRARARLAEQVEKLREYRQALITAAVTGQLDVGEGLNAEDDEARHHVEAVGA